MKKVAHFFISAVCCVSIIYSCTISSDRKITAKSLETGFIRTPDSIQTSIYWYWISDHISEEGVIKDLHAMKEAGINRAFIGNIGLSDAEAGVGKVKFNSDEWWKILHTALKTATELGIDIGIFNSPGWSQSGGPWIKPEQAMRYLSSTKTHVKGGKRLNISLPKPQSEFPFQDVKVIAYPALENEKNTLGLNNAKVISEPVILSLSHIADRDENTEITFTPPYNSSGEVVIDFISNQSFTLRSIKIQTSFRGIRCPVKVQVKKNGIYQTVHEFLIDRTNAQLNVGFDPYAPIVISTPATTAQDFRLLFSNPSPGSGLKEIILSSVPSVERYPEKTLAKMYQTPLPYWHEYQWASQPVIDDKTLLVPTNKVIDLTSKMNGDQLTWEAPEGEWIILRTGMLPTGVTNAPAREGAVGLETDKMSKKHIEAHFDAYMGEILRRIPAEDRKCWKVIVEDSYETGGQNFTDEFLNDFKAKYGYDPVPFLPVYFGVVVESEDISDRFLWDMRRLVADKVSYDYVGGLRNIAHKHGLTTWLENYGHWGFPGEFLQYGGQSDEIGGEFWSEGSLGDIENRAASSCGHIYGKTKISAESFTAGGGGYHRYPAMMKQRGDRFFSEGINNTLLHLYICQPYEDREPGVNAPFANEFNRKNTWYPHLDLFINYIKRVNYMLQQGLNIADVAYFIGEDAPKMTGVTEPQLPKGYQFDYINAEVIERDMYVKDGMLTLPHGTQYRIMVLPKLETMRPELLRKIEQLIQEGGIIMGPAPLRSPSYQNYPASDKEIAAISSRLWGQTDPDKKYTQIGKGTLINGMNMHEALQLINCVPDCKLKSDDPVLYGHRSVNNMDIYFISNQENKPVTIFPEFRVKGMQPELWDATSGSIRYLAGFKETETGTIVPLRLDSHESFFIVFRNPASKTPSDMDLKVNFPAPVYTQKIKGAWEVIFDKEKRGPESPIRMEKLTDLTSFEDFNIKHYSGTILYRNNFEWEKDASAKTFINLNEVYAMAKIKINGKYTGGVWTTPYRVDISDFIKSGNNTIEVEVVTTWLNRLIGDLKLPEAERRTWLTFQPWNAGSSLQKSGLIGPVILESYKYH